MKGQHAHSVELAVFADYGHKAEDAVDYEDIQEQYEGPEVQLGLHDLQFYAQAALAGPPKLPEEDNYDEEEDFDTGEQPTETRTEPPVETVQGMMTMSTEIFLWYTCKYVSGRVREVAACHDDVVIKLLCFDAKGQDCTHLFLDSRVSNQPFINWMNCFLHSETLFP